MGCSITRLTHLIILSIVFCSCENLKEKLFVSPEINNKTLKLVLTDPVETLDPIKIIYVSDWHVASMIYEGLVEYDYKSKSIIPLIAEYWSTSDSGKQWKFRIRDNIRFHDDPCFVEGKGRKLDAYDILYNFERIADPNDGSYHQNLFGDKIVGMNDYYLGKSNSIKGINVLDSNTIEFILNENYVSFLKILATPYAYIVPKEAAKYYGKDFYKNPVGTGAFRLTKWSVWKELDLIRNQDYWKSVPEIQLENLLSKINIKIISDPSLMLSEFFKDDCHIITIDDKTYDYILSQESILNSCNLIIDSSSTSILFFGFSMDSNNDAILNKDFRKAIALSFNRVKLQRNFQNIHIANSLLPQYYLKNNAIEWYGYDPATARNILSQYQSDLPQQKITIFSSYETDDVVELVNSINAIGIDVNLTINKADYYPLIIKTRPDIFRVSMTPSFLDPEEYYSLFYSMSGANINLTSYKNTKYDQVYEQMLIEQDEAKRIQLYTILEEILKEDIPYLPVSHRGYRYYAVKNYIDNFSLIFGIPNYKIMVFKN